MASRTWPTKEMSVTALQLDSRNPRLGGDTTPRSPKEIIEYLFEHDKAMDVAESIATRGFFPNEPLLGVMENGRVVIVEGNRRLAALKALREPSVLSAAKARQLTRLATRAPAETLSTVPVTLAPNRRDTDRLLAGRHIGTSVLPWEAENRARFILDKLAEGYDNAQLKDELGFSETDIQKARQTKAIAEMARSLDLPQDIKRKIENPRANVLTTLERVFDSSVGRGHLKVEKDATHGLRGTTTHAEFVKGFTKLVTDVASGKQSSRTLNTNIDIENYFKGWETGERPTKKPGSFVPKDVINGKSAAIVDSKAAPSKAHPRGKQVHTAVLPRDFKVKHGSHRLIDLRDELVRLERERFPNAGAVLLRAFFELAVEDYLARTGALAKIVEKLGGKENLKFGTPTLKQLIPEIIKVAKDLLPQAEAIRVEKAVRYDAAAPFTVSDLHSFVHQSSDLPTARDILQFWIRTEPLFRLMLEQDTK